MGVNKLKFTKLLHDSMTFTLHVSAYIRVWCERSFTVKTVKCTQSGADEKIRRNLQSTVGLVSGSFLSFSLGMSVSCYSVGVW